MPGVRVTSVRRTVRVAVALVTGQALLCGVIGFVTFGGRSAEPPGARESAPQLAGPPIVVPVPSTPPPSERAERPAFSTVPRTRTQRPTTPPTSVAVRSSAPRSSGPTRTVSVPPAPPAPPKPAPSSTDRALLPPSSPVSGDDEPVPVPDERCDTEDATGRTDRGKAVRCEPDRDGDLRWRLV